MLLLRPVVLNDALSFARVANPVRSVLPRGYQGPLGLGVRCRVPSLSANLIWEPSTPCFSHEILEYGEHCWARCAFGFVARSIEVNRISPRSSGIPGKGKIFILVSLLLLLLPSSSSLVVQRSTTQMEEEGTT